jgi:hypothetical protein
MPETQKLLARAIIRAVPATPVNNMQVGNHGGILLSCSNALYVFVRRLNIFG